MNHASQVLAFGLGSHETAGSWSAIDRFLQTRSALSLPPFSMNNQSFSQGSLGNLSDNCEKALTHDILRKRKELLEAAASTIMETITLPASIASLFSLSGRTAIVTGGTGSLGYAMTLALAEAGADIVSIERSPKSSLASQNLQQAVEQTGRSFTAEACDMSDSASVRAAFARLWTRGVVPDVLLNGAGIQRRGPAESLTDADIDAVLDINLKATFIACQEFAKRSFDLGRPGKIINIGSLTSYSGGTTISPYIASKGGVLQLTKALSCEWAARGIQVNCICPGYFRTPLTEQYFVEPQYEQFKDYILSRTPAGRWGQPEDLRGVVVFLAGRASDFVTGTSVVVDGGYLGR